MPPAQGGSFYPSSFAAFSMRLATGTPKGQRASQALQPTQSPALEMCIRDRWNDGYNESVFTFANNIHTPEGGTHLVGLRTALTRVINDYGRKNNISVSYTHLDVYKRQARG